MAVTAEQVAGVLHTMMHDPDTSKKEAADKWLKEFQKSKGAWEISDQLLHRNISEAVTHFAAQTMKTKILCFFHELPPESHDSLRASLFQHLCNFSHVHAVRVQLCVAVADFILYLATWKHVLPDVLAVLGGPQHRAALVCLLTELPEEVNNSRVNVSQDRRHLVAHELGMDSGGVYPFLMTCWQESAGDQSMRVALINCLRSWLKFGGQGSMGVERLGVLEALFEALAVSELQAEAGPAIEACLMLSSDRDHHLALRERVVAMVFAQLIEPFRVTIAESDEDLGRTLANIFVSMTETEADRLVCAEVPDMNMVELMLLCAQHPEPLVARTTFSFWYNLSDALDATRRDRSRFKEAYSTLLRHLARLVQCPATQTELLSSKDELYDFRLDTKDFVTDTATVIGNAECVRLLTECLLQQTTWQGAEGAMFLLSSVIGRAGNENPDIGRVLTQIHAYPSDVHVALRNSCLVVVGLVAGWICAHDESISPLFRIVCDAVPHRLLARNAVYAVKSLFSAGREKMAPLLPVVYSIFQSGQHSHLHGGDLAELIKGAARVISCLSPATSIASEAAQLCEPFLQDLTKILEGRSTEAPADALENLSGFFHHTNVVVPDKLLPDGSHPLFLLAQRTWIIADALLTAMESAESVVEQCNSCVKWMVRALGRFSAPFLEPIATKAMAMYQRRRYSSFLYVSSILIEVFSKEDAGLPYMYNLLRAFVVTTLEVLGPAEGAPAADPKIVEDFFRLVARAAHLQPMLLLQDQPLTHAVVAYAVEAVLIPTREANEFVVEFLVDLISAGTRFAANPAVGAAILPILDVHGQRLVHNLMFALAGGLPMHMSRDITMVMWELLSLSREHCKVWAASAPCFRPEALDPRLSVIDVQRLIEAIEVVANRDMLRHEFRSFARLFLPID